MKLLKIIMSDDDAEALTKLLEEQELEGTFDEGFTIQVEHIGKDVRQELDKQENEQLTQIYYERFRKSMYEWNDKATKKAWNIMNSKPYEEWEPLLEKHVTREMDRGDIPWIMKYYNDARGESECNDET